MTHVYVVAPSMFGPCKIGIAADIHSRVGQLQTGNPQKLRCYGRSPCGAPRELERMVHEHLAPARLKGEWFEITVPEAFEALAVVGFGQEVADHYAPIEAEMRARELVERIDARQKSLKQGKG